MLDTPLTLELLMLMTAHLQRETHPASDLQFIPGDPLLTLRVCLKLAQANNSKLPVDTPKLVSLLTLALYVMALIPVLVIRQATYDAIQQGGWHPSLSLSLSLHILPFFSIPSLSFSLSLISSSLSN